MTNKNLLQKKENFKTYDQTLAETLRQADKNLSKMPKSYQRMVRMAREEAEAEPLELIHKADSSL